MAVVMPAKFVGLCKRCGRPIRPGALMVWEKGYGVTHQTDSACAEALASRTVFRGPQEEDPEERMIAVQLLLAHPWRSATSKRYEKLPHQYTLRHQWPNDDDFCWVVNYIRRVGYEQAFIGRVWIYYDIGDYQYWDCGGELHPVGGEVRVEGLNRARRRV